MIAACPNCGNKQLQVIAESNEPDSEDTMVICPECAALSWEQDGRVEFRVGERVDIPPESPGGLAKRKPRLKLGHSHRKVKRSQ